MSPTKSHAPLVVAAVTGLIGGIVRYADDVANHGRKFAVTAFFSSVISAGFFGWLVSEAANAAGHGAWSYAAAGIGGWLGPQALDLAVGLARKRLGITDKKETP